MREDLEEPEVRKNNQSSKLIWSKIYLFICLHFDINSKRWFKMILSRYVTTANVSSWHSLQTLPIYLQGLTLLSPLYFILGILLPQMVCQLYTTDSVKEDLWLYHLFFNLNVFCTSHVDFLSPSSTSALYTTLAVLQLSSKGHLYLSLQLQVMLFAAVLNFLLLWFFIILSRLLGQQWLSFTVFL